MFPFFTSLYAVENSLTTIEKDVIRLVNQVKPSVVTVSAVFDYTLVGNDESPDESNQQSYEITFIGSGIVYKNGYIITRESVIWGGKKITVSYSDNTTMTAEIIGSDSELGLAVLKSGKTDYVPVQIDHSQRAIMGCWALIVGNSLGISPAVSLGMINCVRDDGVIQISASVPAGNAGGPVFDARGNLLGIIAARINPADENNIVGSSIMPSETILVYPIHEIQQRIDKIINMDKSHGWIGVSGEDWPGKVGGVHIVHVTPNGPAEKAGLHMSDIILSVNGREITRVTELAETIAQQTPGKDIKLAVLRHNGIHSVTVKVGSAPENFSYDTPNKLPNFAIPRKKFNESLQQNTRNNTATINKEFYILRLNNLEREIQELQKLLKK